jgi:hypothetical protein
MKLDKSKKILIVLGVIFFFIYSWQTFSLTWPTMRSHGGHYISSWPDAMANYFFVGKLSQNNSLSYDEPLNVIANDTVQPRSVNVFDHKIVPTGFLGFILIIEVLGKLFGLYGLMLIISLMAVLAVGAFYGLVKRLYSERVAFMSALLLFILPPFWYYSSLPLVPNVLFLSLVLCAYYLYFKQATNKIYYSLVSGLLFGLALIIRPTEIVWLTALAVIPVCYWREHFKIKPVLIFIGSVLLPVIILLVINQKLYGNAFYTGYLNLEPTKGDNVINRLPPELATNLSSYLAYPKLILAPFSIHPRLIIHNFNNYFIKLLWPWCLLLLGALVIMVRQTKTSKPTRAQNIYLWTVIVVGVSLLIYYGSWLFDDKLTLRLNTIGISYVRYWLPLYVLMLPIIAYGLDKFMQRDSLSFTFSKTLGMKAHTLSKRIVLVVVGLLLFYFSWSTVYLKPGDGLNDQAKITNSNYQLFEAMQAKVPKGAVIINDREDKILFPEYSVIMFNGNYKIWAGAKNIVGKRPIYYLTQARQDFIVELNERLKEFDLRLEKFTPVNDKFTLYSLKNN